MKKTISISTLLLFYTILIAQSTLIEGKITDAETSYALPYSNVFIPATKEGGFANDEGIFQLKADGVTDNDSIWFSHLGYEEIRITLGALKKMGNVVAAKPTQYNLAEVVITPFGARDMVKSAIANTKQNYPSDYSKIRMTFKDFSKRSGHRSHYTYFDLDAYIKSYQGKKMEMFSKVYSYEMYDRKGEFAVGMKPENILQFAMVENTFKEDKLKDFEFTYLGNTTYNNSELDVIGYKSIPTKKNDFVTVSGRVFITKEKKAIEYIEFNVKSERAKRFFLVAKMDTLNVVAQIAFKPVDTLYVVDYAVQTTYAMGTLFGKRDNLVYSTTVKTKDVKLHLKPEEVYPKKEVEEIMKKEKPKDISLMKEDPDMRLK